MRALLLLGGEASSKLRGCWKISRIQLRGLACCFALFAMLPAALQAQYFGRNKVRYETFDFKILKTPDFDVYYYPREHAASEIAGRLAQRWRARLSQLLKWHLPKDQIVILYDNHTAFEGTTVIPGYIGETTGGVTEGLRRRVVMPFAATLGETNHVLGHELVHAFQYDMAKKLERGAGTGRPGILSLPLWFIEGMAEYLSLGPHDPLTAMWMRDAVERDDIPTIKDLDNPSKYFPYRWGQAVWAFVAGRYGEDAVAKALHAAAGGGADGALNTATGVSIKELSKEWHRALVEQYEPVLKITQPAGQMAHTLIPVKKKETPLNVGPVVSPDGSKMILFSQKSLFAIDLYLADANTGKFIRRITESALNPHMDSLEFIDSAGSWSADGKRFAFTTISGGKPELAIYDIEQQKTVRKIRLKQFGAIYSPAWSPDGSRIAFAAMAGGVTDLFVVDLQTKQVTRLTNDAYGDLQPAWSPDGSKLAFVTDRFTTKLSDLSFGAYRIGIFDLNTKAIRQAPGFPNGKNIDPHWSPDGDSIYFISNRDGISNIYRASLTDNHIYQVTNVQTGVTGITALSPAFSVASKAGKIVFSAFHDGRYGVYSIQSASAEAGRPPGNQVAALHAGMLPPIRRVSTELTALLTNPNLGLVSGTNFTSVPYHAKLSLDYVAPPEIAVGATSFGTMVGGGIGLYFSDILGYHNLLTAFQTSTFSELSHIQDSISALALYQNQRHRWTWGILGGQSPFLTGGYNQAIGVVDNRPVLVNQSILFWEVNREVQGILAYPFNRAQRIEFSTGYQRISYETEVRTHIYDFNTGQLLSEQKTNPPPPDAINLSTSSAALVYDTSIFGGTSPIAGQRYRLEAGASEGTFSFTTLLADYRRYFRLARQATLAFRFMHYGRYGGDSGDPRLSELFLGYPWLVRGYAANSFTPAECGVAAEGTGACPIFDQLVGSRIAVANAELRIPLFGILGVIHTPRVPPVEIAPFYDAGYAWHRRVHTPRHVVRSTGVSLRANVLGYAVAEISYVHPFDRPGKSWLWEFSLIPGF